MLAPVQQGSFFYVSPHGVHVATVGTSGSRATVIYDGVEGPKFDEILRQEGGFQSHVVFSPDGNRYAYCARSGDQFVVMVDGKELTRSSESNDSRFSGQSCALGFTSNSKHVYYTSQADTANTLRRSYQRFVFDGKAGPPNDSSQGMPFPVFSPDGSHYAYLATDGGGGLRLGLDGVVQSNSAIGTTAAAVGVSYVFSPDSKHIARFASPPTPTGNYERGIFLDGKYIPLGPSQGVYTQLTFTPDSKHLLWARNEVIDGASAFRVFVDGKPVAEGFSAGNAAAMPGWWDMGPDGTLRFLAQDDNSLKRIRVTPSPDTSIETLLASGR